MVHTIQEHPQSLGNANNDFATRVGNEGSDHESEAKELEKDTRIMAEASEEPQFGLDHYMFDEASRIPLYEGAALSGLATTLFILNCCRTQGTSNAFINEMLHLLKMNILPQPNTLPSNEYEASNILKKLRLAYNVIHVCPKGHMLFRGQYENDQNCPQCRLARYKLVGKSFVPHKVLRHFPIIPRLKRMYSTPKQASLMTWHINNRSGDGMVCHAVNFKQWRFIDEK
jgi:hypothetical protein